MGQVLDDPVRHNSWANAQLLAFCRGLDEAALGATVPGTFGTVIETLQHTIRSDTSYLFRLTGEESARPWPRDDAVGVDVLVERAAALAATWERFLAGEVDGERPLEGRGTDPERYTVPAGVFIAQALHHGSEHRAQVCTILGALGHEPPDLSVWGYAFATERARV